MKSLLKKLHFVSEEAEKPTSPRCGKSPKHNSNSFNPAVRVARVEPSSCMSSLNSPDPEIEEEYQIQLALELSAREDPEAVQIETVKQISLGSCSLENTQSQVLAFRYWNHNALSYDDKILDGFYDVYDIKNESISEKMPSFDDLQGTSLSDGSRWEAILVNRAVDDNLLNLEHMAFNLRSDFHASVSAELVQKLAIFVSESMGGPVGDPDNMSKVWKSLSIDLKSTLRRVVLPLGSLRIGLARHRALLFKVLTDSLEIPCRLVKQQYSGFDCEAIIFVKIEDGREYIVDLMSDPGTLIPSDVAGSQQNFEIPRSINNDHIKSSKVTSEDSRSPFEANKVSFGEITIMPPIQCHPHARSPSWTEGVSSPAVRKMKAKDVSLYMIDAAKENPRLAQKLHDVLLESGVVAPPNLFNMGPVPVVAAADSTASETYQRDNGNGNGIDSEALGLSDNSSKSSGNDSGKSGVGLLDDVAECEIAWADIVLGERIGLGSYGEVYRGDLYGTEVAVKKFLDQGISGESIEEFKTEVRIMKRLRHPNVVLFMGAITTAPNLSIVTEFLPRGSLYRLIRRPNNQLDERRRLKMALDTARGMNYLHKCTPVIVHRDLKSPNLLVDKNWVVKYTKGAKTTH